MMNGEANWYQNNQIEENLRTRVPPWVDKLDKKHLFVFAHIPKAGGTSLNGFLEEIYGQYMVKYHENFNPNLFQEINRKSSNDILCISSHYGFGIHRFFGSKIPETPFDKGDGLFSGREINYVTIVRNPLDRMISYYNFVTTFQAHRHYETTKKMNIYEFFGYLEKQQDIELCNLQCYLISGRTSRVFEDARKIIDKEFFAAAPVEKSIEFIDFLTQKMAWPRHIQYVKRNISPKKSSAREIDTELKDYILKSNEEDYKLYKHVDAKFDHIIKTGKWHLG